MRRAIERLLHWTPRVLGLLFAAFVSVFALDGVGTGNTFWQTILTLTTTLIPTAVILGALALSWRWGWAGGLVFLALGSCYLVTSWGLYHWSTYVEFAGPLFLLGLLFEIDWWYARLRTMSRWGNET
jgi:hypothetical protein